MGNRTIDRSIARKLYGDFSRRWRRDVRLAGKKGSPGTRKPTFHQWNEMHLRNHEMMRESTPLDVLEYLGHDPWETKPIENAKEERGVVTLPISGGDDNP